MNSPHRMGDPLNGIFPGIVEATTDPKMLGRCRVRVPTVDGDESSTPPQSLAWAMPCFPAMMFDVPQVGDAVWVMFQGGDRLYPVYLGWFPSTPMVVQNRQRHPSFASLTYGGVVNDGDPLELSTPQTPVDNDTPLAGAEPYGPNVETYQTPAGVCETPPEARKGRDWDPNTRIFKTFRGHTIEFSDHPEAEYLKIIDRSGQMILFDCAVTMSSDQNNATPRGGSIENCFVNGIGEADKQVLNGRTQLPIGAMRQRPGENPRACIRMTDLFGQYLEYWSEENNSHIRIQSARSKDDDQTPNHYFMISSAEGNEFIKIMSREGHEILIDETNDQIVITHKSGHKLVFNGSNIISGADASITGRLLFLENAIAKYNSHIHGSGPPPSLQYQFGEEDGTSVTLAG